MLTLHVQQEIYRVEEKGITFSEHNIIKIKVCLVQNCMLDGYLILGGTILRTRKKSCPLIQDKCTLLPGK